MTKDNLNMTTDLQALSPASASRLLSAGRIDRRRDGDEDYQTPPWVCDYMASLVPSNSRLILEPTPGKGNLVAALKRKGFTVVAPEEFWDITEDCRVDCVVMNPPFDKGIEYRILDRVMTFSENLIALMPWNTIINADRRTERLTKWGLRSVTRLPRKAFPRIRTQCCILEMAHGFIGATELKFVAPPNNQRLADNWQNNDTRKSCIERRIGEND